MIHSIAEMPPHEFIHADTDTEQDKLLNEYFMPGFRKGYVRMGPNKVVMPIYYLEFVDRIENMEVRDSDVWVVSHPKTGTTWTQEMTWVIGHDLDFEAAKVPLPERFPFLDHSPLFDYTDMLPKIPEFVLPDFIIYVARNAKDTCVSYYHHCKLMEGYSGSFEDYCKLFLGGSLCFAPFWPHVLNFWKRRDEANILFLKFEDLKKVLTDHLSFSSMKNNPAVNYEAAIEINRKFNLTHGQGHFMRSGQVGNYKEEMSPELIAKFDRWTQENLAGSGLSF
ncbi:hypothetical protein C0J52_00108 [Blattella germanica]|nr:hypothetical protein C0J52_00108 [Blattella germanica]